MLTCPRGSNNKGQSNKRLNRYSLQNYLFSLLQHILCFLVLPYTLVLEADRFASQAEDILDSLAALADSLADSLAALADSLQDQVDNQDTELGHLVAVHMVGKVQVD